MSERDIPYHKRLVPTFQAAKTAGSACWLRSIEAEAQGLPEKHMYLESNMPLAGHSRSNFVSSHLSAIPSHNRRSVIGRAEGCGEMLPAGVLHLTASSTDLRFSFHIPYA